MAPASTTATDSIIFSALRQRDGTCPPGLYYSYGLCLSAWDYYGRWIFAAVVIGLIILFALSCACLKSRRRRRAGLQPMYGTGWMAPGPHPQHDQSQAWANQPPPPAYGAPSYPMNPQPTGDTFRTADGYYGQHEGISPPKNVYGGEAHSPYAHDNYAPPPGPPPFSSRQ